MASAAQMAANRANALHSTGPRSAAGKAVSRFNALKSGIDAKSVIIPGEDPEELAALIGNYQLQFQPITPVEQFLLDRLVDADWQLRRYRKLEALHLKMADPAHDFVLPPDDRLNRVHRRIDAAERSYFRSLKELQRQIENRSEITEPESNEFSPELGSFRQVAVAATAVASTAPAAHRSEPQENLALRL